jgi:PPOX class probable F420-dependent enzyme
VTSAVGSRTNLSPAARRFLEAQGRFATIATINPDGSPHQTVVWFLLEDDDSLIINSLVGRRWPSNLRRDPRISLSVEDGLDYVTVRGSVEEIDDGQRAQADIAAMARRYETPQKAEEMIERRFRPQHRVSFRLRPRSITVHFEA